ncbi:MAG: hypothetical protein AB1515_00760 [Nitrospirota bacterium]
MRGSLWGCGVLVVMILQGGLPAWAAEDEEAPNTLGASAGLSGLTGLAITASAHTLAPWTATASGAVIYTDQQTPDQQVLEGRAIVGLGLPRRVELTATVPAVRRSGANTGLGDVRLAGKWRFLDQRESLWPALALAAVATLPTGQQSKGLRTVQDYGAEIKLLASAEIDFTPDFYAIGLYFDGGFFLQDSGQPTEDKYGTFALGAALPILMLESNPLASPLQVMLEASGTYKRGTEQDIYVFTPSLRYTGPVTATAGFQYTTFQETGIDDAIGAVIQVSVVFP